KFVPGGRILSGAGAGHQVTFYNCFVVGLGEDPLDPAAPRKPMLDPAAARPAFFNALAQMTDIMSRSGGVGMNLSALPPRGTPITAEGRGRHGPVRPTVALSLSHPDVGRLLGEKDGPNLAHVDVAVIVPPEFDQALADDAGWTSRLRPKGAYIKTVNGTSSGPVAWMYLYDAVARADDGAAPAEKGVIWFGEIASVITGKTIQQGGCFGPDQRIATSRGLLRAVELADLIDAGEKVDALTHEGPRPITWSFRNGTKPLF